jgi:hypothetical protein
MTIHSHTPGPTSSPVSHDVWWRLGDAIALVTVSGLAAAVMSLAHQVFGTLIVSVVLGMVAATVVQMVFSFVASFLLGTIETQVPAMVGGMLAPMGICAAGLLVHVPTHDAFAIGAAFGLGLVFALERYRRTCATGAAFDREF